MISGGKTHRGVFQMRSMRIYGRFLSEQGAMMPFPRKRSLSGEESGISLSRVKS